MKSFFSKIAFRRFFWFLVGMITLPILSWTWSLVFPTAKDAMGFVGFYEEHISLYTFLGDHSYSLAFPGDEQRFHAFAKRLGFASHKKSENEYEEVGKDWKRGVAFNPDDSLRNITFTSSSY